MISIHSDLSYILHGIFILFHHDGFNCQSDKYSHLIFCHIGKYKHFTHHLTIKMLSGHNYILITFSQNMQALCIYSCSFN